MGNDQGSAGGLVELGFFRAELLSTKSTTYAQPFIDDYAERTPETVRLKQHGR